MGFFSSLFGAVLTVAATVVNVAVKATSEIINAAADFLDEFTKKKEKDKLPEAEETKYKADDELKNINDELLAILDKYQRNGRVSLPEKRRAEYLRDRRNELKGAIKSSDEIISTTEIVTDSEAFKKISVGDKEAHIIQGQVGVSSFGKSCSQCGREMQIQWPRTVKTASVGDFFWGCTGWFFFDNQGHRRCQHTEKMSSGDLSIFTRSDNPEAEVSNDELTTLVTMPEPSKIITERMDDVISDQKSQRRGTNDYRCPVHGELLVLRRKKNAVGLLDQYFLGCSHWKPNNTGCSYIVKLKSVMQLSNLLAKESGTGVL
ncbi:ribosome recycling factor [Psychromonas ingrahamii 37]|uniref:Ribosome recycling factor n=1 Tax=Psychromonas ingrahamii (strain DSM 17664 / CCUG 51855 / 37) TaxID=357804 RepID=A1SY33_PSYIN|nr:hypothetical protein [Psychromonas ingrahamii]ABM04398.1 ribosome recycling factor [Psychromonas ingrahamii 37]